MQFHDRLRKIRKDLKLKQIEMADRLRISLGTLQRHEKGMTSPSLNTLERIASFGFDLHWLITGSPATEDEKPLVHSLKILPEYYDLHCNGSKTFEIRQNDRDFQVGDFLLLEEYFPETKRYTGRSILKPVKYIFHGGQFGLEPGFVIISTG